MRVALVLPMLAGVALLFWWRGPDWSAVYHAFDAVNWSWVALAVGLNLALRRCSRAVAWRLTIGQAMPTAAAGASAASSRPSASGCSANAVLPGRIGELARVAVLRRRLPHGRGTSAALVGTVFAHRLFDLVPGRCCSSSTCC